MEKKEKEKKEKGREKGEKEKKNRRFRQNIEICWKDRRTLSPNSIFRKYLRA